ncbi:hypothetical protein ASE08_26860 [Rhizobacter sp. Root16D2]|nr:hypothetical protein ASC88_17635 [Rhizobacter sp. Root29]KQW13939.1 hypothetical protein ASC98_17770 [Rhizobacter sp. Root1238]KRB15759.1 hypothetical protein ASE08_26860 [Rhizobacter sp. Root16D2]
MSAENAPNAVGLKYTATVQLAPAAKVVPQLVEIGKLLACAPVTATDKFFREPPFNALLVTVNDLRSLDVLTVCSGHAVPAESMVDVPTENVYAWSTV